MTEVNYFQPERFDLNDSPDFSQTSQRMLQYLKEFGYVVIANVASQEDITKAKDDFWGYMESVGALAKRHDPSTWSSWLGNRDTGIIGSPFFNHSSYMWNTRCLPLVRKAFSILWESDDLIVSFDAGNAYRPWRRNVKWLTKSNWWHVDQNALKGPLRQGRACVQGLVTYYDVTEDTGGLCVIPGSHIYHNELCERNAQPCDNPSLLQDFVYVKSEDPVLRSAPARLVGAKAGDLILWDSRVVHCNTPSLLAPKDPSLELSDDSSNATGTTEGDSAELARLVGYVCMLPRSSATKEALESKVRGFMCSMPTSHWPQELIDPMFLSDDNIRIDWKEWRPEVLRLVGFTENQINNKRLNPSLTERCSLS